MTSISIRGPGGEPIAEAVEIGRTLMEVLRDLGQVDAICGGTMSCGTCAVRVSAPWCDSLETESENERALLEGLGLDGPGCRLSCQIPITAGLDGVIIETLRSS